jgi:hypothetical protein
MISHVNSTFPSQGDMLFAFHINTSNLHATQMLKYKTLGG